MNSPPASASAPHSGPATHACTHTRVPPCLPSEPVHSGQAERPRPGTQGHGRGGKPGAGDGAAVPHGGGGPAAGRREAHPRDAAQRWDQGRAGLWPRRLPGGLQHHPLGCSIVTRGCSRGAERAEQLSRCSPGHPPTPPRSCPGHPTTRHPAWPTPWPSPARAQGWVLITPELVPWQPPHHSCAPHETPGPWASTERGCWGPQPWAGMGHCSQTGGSLALRQSRCQGEPARRLPCPYPPPVWCFP